MTRRIQLTMSVTLVLFVFLTPYISLVYGQDLSIAPTPITIFPIPPELTTNPPMYTIPPDLAKGYSKFASRTPRIDGAITSGFDYQGKTVQGEWDDAIKLDFQLAISQIATRQSELHNATMYIKNDYINLYLALVVQGVDYNAGDTVHFNIDSNNNNKKDLGDDLLSIDGPKNEYTDMYYQADGSSTKDSEQNGVGASKWYNVLSILQPVFTVQPITITMEPYTTSGKAAQDRLDDYRYLSGTWIFETAHPLNSLDSNDLNTKPGDAIGINVAYWDDKQVGNVGGFPSYPDWTKTIEYIIAGPPVTGATADLSIHSIILNQAVQNETGGLPLARRKTTIGRVFLDIGTTGPIPANVYLYGLDGKTGTTLSGPLVASVNAPSSSFRTRAVITHSANFLLPTSWIDRDFLNLTAFVTSTTVETNFNNNWFVPAQQFTFHQMKVLNVYEVPINTGTMKNPVTVSKALITQNEQAMRRVFPVEKINFIRMDWRVMGGNWTGTFPQAINKLNEIVGQLVMAWLLAFTITGEMPTFPLPDLIYGYYTQNVVYGGLSDPTWAGGKGVAAVGYIATNEELTMAHECTHNLDRANNGAGTWGRHTGPTGSNCGASGPDSSWPHVDDDIDEVGIVASVWPPVIIPRDYPDYMSYCNSSDSNIADTALMAQYTQWISDYRWERLFEELELSSLYPAPATAASMKYASEINIDLESANLGSISSQVNGEEPEPLPQMLQISGWLSRDGKGSIDSIVQLDSPKTQHLAELLEMYPWLKSYVGDLLPPSEPQIIEGTFQYELVVIDPAGNEMRPSYFNGQFLNAEDFEEEQEYFSHRIPRLEGLEPGARIELRLGERILDVQEVTDSVPEVYLLSPSGGEEWVSDELVEIIWDAGDADGGSLDFTIQYSPDGYMWIPLTSGRNIHKLTVDPSKIPGSSNEGAYIRVLASDGFNTGKAQNREPFFVRDKAPDVTIDLPIDGQVFGSGDLIPLKGHAYDLEDGEIPGKAIRWEYAGGILGYGHTLEVVRLGPGEHIFYLVAVDSAGNEGITHVRIIIGFEDIVPPVTEETIIRVGPDTLSFQADINAPIHAPGEPAVLIVEATNTGADPAIAVDVLMRLPIGLVSLSDSDHVGWEFIEPGQTVGWEFLVRGDEIGIYEIGFELDAANRSPAVELVVMSIGEGRPDTTPPEESGLNIRAELEPRNVLREEPMSLLVQISNNEMEPVYGVEMLIELPPGLFMISESELIGWEIIESGQSVEWEYILAGEKNGDYEINILVFAANHSPVNTVVELRIGEELTVTETKPPDETKPPSVSRTTSSSDDSTRSPSPGFEAIPVFMAIPFLLWIRKRRQRK